MGTRTTYDALGLPTEVQQDSELGVLSTTYAYLPGFLTRVTAPGGGVTLTSYQTFDQPSTDQVRGIAHPEGAYTDIPRDVFGKPTSITRRNLDRSIQRSRLYAYDAFQQLCRTYEPETGTTLMGYDAAGNLAWSAAGLPWSTTCADADTQPVVDRSSTRTYDKRNRLSVLEFADDTGEQVWTYTPDSLPDKVYTYNDAGRTQTVYNAYSYNSRRMLGSVGELLNYPGWTWSLGYGYDKNGFLTAQTYPDTSSYQFAVNALGQTTGITGTSGTYVSGASYHPNGALKQFTYGNGIVHTLEQNARGLPQRSKDAYGTGPAVLDDNYVYDGNGNVAAILDGRPAYPGRPAGWSSRTMTYDGLNRLTSVDAPMFNGTISYTYDVLDNIETLVDATRNLRYCYEAFSNRLDFIRSGASDCTSGTATTSFDFDVQGNIRWKNNQAYKFTFDNRLREVVGKESYRYDAHGRRVTQDAPTLATIRSFYRNDGQLVYQANGRTGKNLAYLYLAGSLVATREQPTAGGAATLKFHHTDALGSPVAVTDAARGVIEWSDHEPYGKVVHRPLRDGPGFTGHVEDAQTGLNYMQQRYYDPMIGRFLSVDPVTADGATGANFNRYWYASNNPYRFTDPDGRQPCSDACMRQRATSDGMAGGGSDPAQDSHPITDNERNMQASGDLQGFWQSRAQAGSPWAQTALGIWSPDDATLRQRALGSINLFRLNAALVVRDGLNSSSDARGAEILQMGREIAGRYIQAVDQNRGFEPTLSQSNAYHYSIFRSHGLSGEAYGGTPLGYTPSGIGRYLGELQSRFLNWNPLTRYCEGCSP